MELYWCKEFKESTLTTNKKYESIIRGNTAIISQQQKPIPLKQTRFTVTVENTGLVVKYLQILI